MTKLNVGILMAAVAMIVAATYFELSFATGVSGVLLIVGLGYSYVVATREARLLSYALEEREVEGFAGLRNVPERPEGNRFGKREALNPAE
jgi:hypothetical protein